MNAPRHRGFTLIELLVVIAIITILATWAVPNFNSLAARSELDQQTDKLWQALSATRLEAADRRGTTHLCPSSDGSTCSDNWQNALLLFEDRDDDASLSAGDELIQRFNAADKKVSISDSKGLGNGISFQADGFTSDWTTFALCHQDLPDEAARLIVISKGRMRRDRGDDDSCSS